MTSDSRPVHRTTPAEMYVPWSIPSSPDGLSDGFRGYGTAERLLDAVSACREIQEVVEGRSIDDYFIDRKLQLPIERRFEIAGKVLNLAAPLHAHIIHSVGDLRRFVELRNQIIHSYDSVDSLIVWNIIT